MDYSKLRIFAGAICLLVLMLLCGCTHKVYVPVERTVVHTDTGVIYSAKIINPKQITTVSDKGYDVLKV